MMNNLFSTNDENDNQNVTIESSLNETGPLSKKRKLSNGETSSRDIELKYLKLEKEEWKQLAQKLEAEKRQHIDGCNAEKILELEDTVKMLQTIIAKNDEEKRQYQAQMDLLNSAIEEHITKVKTLEDEKKEFESKIQELTDEISSMKTIKTEIKDSVENEREIFQVENDKLKAEANELKNHLLEINNRKLVDIHVEEIQRLKEETKKCEIETKNLKSEINQLKNQNSVLEKRAQESEIQRSVCEKRCTEVEKKFGETVAANQELGNKCKELEATINKNMKEYQSTIDGLKAENQNLSKTNTALMNNEKVLQNSINEYKKKIEDLKMKESETKVCSLNEIFNDSKHNDALFSCKSNIVANITKLEGKSSGVWEMRSITDSSKNRFFLSSEEIIRKCFKMNINGQLSVQTSDLKLKFIMHKINTCELTKLEINFQIINYTDFQKLVSSKKIEICILKCCTVLNENENCSYKEFSVDELLIHLPNIKEFKYVYMLPKSHLSLAKNLGQLQPFPNLQKFQISNLSESFKFEELEPFIKKNNKNVSYDFAFSRRIPKNMQKEIEAAKNELLKSLSFPYKICLV